MKAVGCVLLTVLAAAPLLGGCKASRSLVVDSQPPGRYGLYEEGAERPAAVYELRRGERLGIRALGRDHVAGVIVEDQPNGIARTTHEFPVDGGRAEWKPMGR